MVVVFDTVIAHTGHHTHILQRTHFVLREYSQIIDIGLIIAYTFWCRGIRQRIADVFTGDRIAHHGNVIAVVRVIALIPVHTGDQARLHPVEVLLVLQIQSQRINMVIVLGALTDFCRTAATHHGVARNLTVIILTFEQRYRRHAITQGFSFPRQTAARGFIFAVSEGIDAFTVAVTEICLIQRACHGRIQIGMYQRSA